MYKLILKLGVPILDKTLELKKRVNNYILEILKSENFKAKISEMLNTSINDLIFEQKDNLIKSDAYIKIRKKVKAEIVGTLNSYDFKKHISTIIDSSLANIEKSNKTLETIVPSAVVNSLKVYIYNHKDEIINTIKGILNNKNLDKKIFAEVTNAVNGLNPMVSRFININSIYSKLKISIEDYLNDTKNVIEIINFINSQIDSFMKKRLSEITSYFPTEGRKSIANSIAESISDTMLKADLITNLLNMIDERLSLELSKIDRSSDDINQSVTTAVSALMGISYDKLLDNEDTQLFIYSISEEIVDNILSKPIVDLI